MDSLFDVENEGQGAQDIQPGAPLADRMRPQRLADVLGQQHLLSDQGPLHRFSQHGRFPSIIFWGPPGVGKTTLAMLMSREAGYHFVQLSAIEAGVKELREVIASAGRTASRGRKTLLFIDEIHRFNKNQQDALLHAVEKGVLTLIGATTENPSFEVNAALLSRCQVYRLRSLSDEDIRLVLEQALQKDAQLQALHIEVQDWDTLLTISGGDARTALNALELAANVAEEVDGRRVITRAVVENALQQKTAQYDKKGESHYDTISAFIKSLRGSDPDAALFWLAKMIDAGEDPRFIARRMVIFASEDIGNADPSALALAIAVFQAVDIIGMPEARINLSHGVCYLASTHKSNAAYMGIENALAAVRSGISLSVPLHLRNAPTRLMKQEGYGQEYKYPHSYPEHFVHEDYFPSDISPQHYYKATSIGAEQQLQERLQRLWGDRFTAE